MKLAVFDGDESGLEMVAEFTKAYRVQNPRRLALEAEATYQETRAMGLRRRNLYFIFSAKRDTHIESDLITYQLSGPQDSRRLFCASDAPYGRQTWNFGGFRWMLDSLKRADIHPDPRIRENPGLFDEDSISGFMGENFLRLIETTYDRLISRR
ncbi:MAG: hypothetical protein ACLFPV_04735 [Spirochaetaceae bacterium]